MSHQHEVYIQNTEENDEAVSATGVVDGRQCAVVVQKALLPKPRKARDQAIAFALGEASHSLLAAVPAANAIVVNHEDAG